MLGKIAVFDSKKAGIYLQRDDPFARVIGEHYVADLISPIETEIIGVS